MCKRPLLLGHRGTRVSPHFPENTLLSFDAALEHGCDGFEFDLRLERSGRAVVCHDPTVAGHKVAQTSNDQLLLPELSDVLRRYVRRAFLDIESKVPGLESELLGALNTHAPERGFVVSSFLPAVLEQLRLRNGVIPLGLICDRSNQVPLGLKMAVQYVILHHSLVNKDLLREIASAGKKSMVWTVNDSNSMLRFADWGVDGIVSDDTELMVQTFGRRVPDVPPNSNRGLRKSASNQDEA
jgi:glycerophosphoryl diester phosphodiesterase